MRALHATVIGLLASSIAGAGLGCRPSPRASRPPDGGALVTVYVPARMADQVMGRLQAVAARHQWALSGRTRSAALAHAHLTVVDSAGPPGAPGPSGTAVSAQAGQLGKGGLP